MRRFRTRAQGRESSRLTHRRVRRRIRGNQFLDDLRHVPFTTKESLRAAGLKAVGVTMKRAVAEMGVTRTARTLTKLNQAMETEIEQRVEQIRASLREKETLLKEIHHRVKNNLQVISSLLSLQSDRLADTTVRQLFLDARDRVRSMALVHEKLYNSQNLARVELGEYTRSLMNDLLQGHAALASKVRLQIEQDAVFLDE